jgi:hypothetical protein
MWDYSWLFLKYINCKDPGSVPYKGDGIDNLKLNVKSRNFWEANHGISGQETHHLWNTQVNYPVCKIHLLVPVLSQINPVHALIIYFFKIHLESDTIWSTAQRPDQLWAHPASYRMRTGCSMFSKTTIVIYQVIFISNGKKFVTVLQ